MTTSVIRLFINGMLKILKGILIYLFIYFSFIRFVEANISCHLKIKSLHLFKDSAYNFENGQ